MDFSDVYRVFQDVLDVSVFHPVAKTGAHTQVIELARNFHIAHAAQKVGVNHLHQRSGVRVGDILLIFNSIAKRGIGQRFTAVSFFGHAAGDLLGKVYAVIFVHCLDDGFGDDGHFIVPDVFADRNHVDAQLLAQHGFVDNAVLAVAGKPRKLPDQDGIKGLRVFLGSGNHPHKFRALGAVSARATLLFDKDILFRQDKIAVFGVATNLA